MYVVTISATFKEYPLETTYVSPSMEESVSFVLEVLSDISENSSSEREKNFSVFLKNKLLSGDVSAGFGTINHVAYDIAEQSEFCKKKEKEVKNLSDRIDKLNRGISKSRLEIEEIRTKLGNIE